MNIFDIIIVQPIFNLLITIYALLPGGDFGLALIIFTIIVRLAMWPLVKKQLHQVKAMRKLQPELAKIKKETKGNRQLESMRMLELYKKHGVNPFRSIGILVVQIPIFLALYSVIQIFTLHRDQVAQYTYGFLEVLQPIKELINNPDQFNETLFGIINLTQSAVNSSGFNQVFLFLLAIIAASTQWIMSKQTMPQQSKKSLRSILKEASSGKQADQSEINSAVMGKMMIVLPFFMFFIMISLPGALALYYAVSNIVAVIQQHIILKQDVEEMEEIVDNQEKASKKATLKAREKNAKEANITRIVAKDNKSKSQKKKEK